MISRVLTIAFFLLFSVLPVIAQTRKSCGEGLFPIENEKGIFGYKDLNGQWKIKPNFSEVMPFVGEKAQVKKGNKFGIINCAGTSVLACEFDEIAPIAAEHIWAQKNKKWFLFQSNGKLVKETSFSNIEEVSYASTVTWLKLGDFFGLYSNNENKFICDPQFLQIQIISDSSTLVKKNTLFGLVSNVNGNYLVEPTYKEIKVLTKGILAFKESDTWGIMTENGKIVKTAQYDSLSLFVTNLLIAKIAGKYGILDSSSTKVLPLEYESIGNVSEGLAPIAKNSKMGYFEIPQTIAISPQFDSAFLFKQGVAIVSNAGKYGLIDRFNKTILPLEYDRMVRDTKQSYIVIYKNGKQLIYDVNSGRISQEFDKVTYSDTSTLVRVTNKGKVGCFNILNQQYVINPDYDMMGTFIRGFSVCKNGAVYGVINKNGKTVIHFDYKGIRNELLGIDLKFKVLCNGMYGILDTTEKTIIPTEYQFLSRCENDVYKAQKDGNYGLLNSTGKPLTKFKYEFISNYKETPKAPEWPAIIKLNGKYGLLNYSGSELVEPTFANMSYQGEWVYAFEKSNKFPFEKNNKIGVIDIYGTLFIDAQFDSVGICLDNQLAIKLKGKWGAINKIGQYVVKPEYEQYLQFPDGTRRFKRGEEQYLLMKNGSLNKLTL
jgi:hypothetical protein